MVYLFRMAGNFKWMQNTDGSINIFDVEFASDIAATDRPDFGMTADIDEKWFTLAIRTFSERKEKGKATKVFLNHGGEQIGTIEDMRYVRPFAVCDMRITNPVAIEKIKRGELVSRSMDFYPESYLIYGLSLLDGEGHFDEEIRDLTLIDADTKALVGAQRLCAAMVRGRTLNLKKAEAGMPIDEAMRTEIMGMIESAIQAFAEQNAAKPADTNAGAEAAAMARIAALESKAETETMVANPIASGVRLPAETLRADLAKLKTVEGREQYCERVKATPRDFDTPVGDAKPKPVLAAQAEWRAGVDELEKSGLTRQAASVKLAGSNPELHKKMLAEANPGKQVA